MFGDVVQTDKVERHDAAGHTNAPASVHWSGQALCFEHRAAQLDCPLDQFGAVHRGRGCHALSYRERDCPLDWVWWWRPPYWCGALILRVSQLSALFRIISVLFRIIYVLCLFISRMFSVLPLPYYIWSSSPPLRGAKPSRAVLCVIEYNLPCSV